MKIKRTNRHLTGRATMAMSLLLLLTGGAVLSLLSAEARISPAISPGTPGAFQEPDLLRRYQQTITPKGLAARLYFLASDAFEGRETATRGQKMAAQYLASQYAGMGLAPKGTVEGGDTRSPESFFQPFKLYKRDAMRSELEVKLNGQTVLESDFSPDSQDDMAYFAFGRMSAARGGVVFAGYGIKDDGLKYNDFAALREKDLSVDGKWVMILADEPLRDASTSLLPTADGKPSRWSARLMFDKKLALWLSGKPAGVLVIGDATPRAPKGGFIVQTEEAARNLFRIGNLSLYPASAELFPPTYIISTQLADRILSGSDRTVRDVAREINRSLKPVVFDVKGAEVSARAEAFPPLETENVLALIEGSDPKLKDEVVVVSAHYDHLGINPQLKGDQIYNGAADDASGTVATLAIAEAFMRAKADGKGPRRSILFFNPSGEEKGRQGSAYYTDIQPIIPLEKIVANINMDGIGGVDTAHAKTNPNYVYILGTKEISSELLETAKRLNRQTGTNLLLEETPNFGPDGSDHFNFQKMFVPYIYYSTGLTEHYHQPSDEPETINYEHLARVTRLSFATAWEIANSDIAPARIGRDRLALTGYGCPPCGFACDGLKFDAPGTCPICNMPLYLKYELKK